MKEKNIWTPGELDTLLRTYGGTLAQEKRFYAEYTLGRAMVGQGLNFNPTVSYDEMLRFYQEHEKDYLIPTRVRFEIMSARFANFPNKQKANEAICAMGNEVFYGASFAAVAKRSSQGLNAEQGGYHDWTNRGALASKAVDEALFSLEPGKLSQVIEDERGYHIVRVLERQEAGKVPFEEVQSTIRDKVKQEKMSKQYREVAVKFRQGVTVWTAFDEDPQLGKLFRRDTKTR
jgi:parvulin-like peptidyl-prolyl isomerase